MNESLKSIKLIPVMILQDVVLPHGGLLPLNIFEERYKELLHYALANNREIVIAQTTQHHQNIETIATDSEVYPIAGLGRIIHFEEKTNGTFRITLMGRHRVRLVEHKLSPLPFALYYIDSYPYLHDLTQDEFHIPHKKQFFNLYREYCNLHNIDIDWEGLQMLDDSKLLNILSMTSRFSAAEKQSLLESVDMNEKLEKFSMMVNMAISGKYLHHVNKTNPNQVAQ